MKTQRPENITVYPLSPAQQMVKMARTFTFNPETTQIPLTLNCDRVLDQDLMKKAINEEIRRNDSLRVRFFKENKQILQYYGEAFDYAPHFVDLSDKTEKEVADYIKKTACKVLKIEKNQFFEFYIIYKSGNRTAFFMVASHFVLDTMGIFVTMYDILSIYLALKDGTEMPKPLAKSEDQLIEALKYPGSEAFEKDRTFFREYIQKNGEPIYNSFDGQAKLERDRKKSKNPNQRFIKCNFLFGTKTELQLKTATAEETKAIRDFCQEKKISPQMLFVLGERIWCSKVNDGEPHHVFFIMIDGRTTLASKKCGGDLVGSVICHSYFEKETTFGDALSSLLENQQQLYRHYRFTNGFSLDEMAKIFHMPQLMGYESHMFTYMPLEKPEFLKDWNISVESVSVGHFSVRLYEFIYNDLDTGNFIFRSEYQPSHYTREQISSFVDKSLEAILMGIKNPDLTLKEMYEKL